MIGNFLYFPVFEIAFPLKIEVETIPSMSGINFKPASVAEAPFTTCRYKGNITIAPNIPAPITAPRIDVSVKVWFLKSSKGKIGSFAFDSQ